MNTVKPIGIRTAAITSSRCPFPEDCEENGCSGHCADVRQYGLVTDYTGVDRRVVPTMANDDTFPNAA